MGSTDRWVEACLRWAAAGVCLGVGITGILHDLPLRSLFWDENWWGGVAALFGYQWQEWVTSPVIDARINLLSGSLGTVLLLGGLLLLLRPRWIGKGWWVLFFILLLQHFLSWKEHFWQLGQVLELVLQTGAVPLYFLFVEFERQRGTEKRRLHVSGFSAFSAPLCVKILIAFTFLGHGLYAVGFHPVPAHFVFMTQTGLGVGEETARQLLFFVGILDFLAAVLLLLPWKKVQIAALWWIIPWALLTTLARVWSYGGLVAWDTLLTQWLPEVVRRLPHVLIPLAVCFSLFRARTQVP